MKHSLLAAVLLLCPTLSFAANPADASIGGHQAKFIEADRFNTRYYDVGQGQPLLLVHGGPWEGTSSANDWALNLAGLGQHFRVLAPDKLGNGLTDNPGRADEQMYNPMGQIQHLAGFIETMDLGPMNVVAHGTGGVALFLAMERPDLVKSLVLVSSNTASPAVGDDQRAEALADCPWSVNGEEIGPWLDELECRIRKVSYDDGHLDNEWLAAAETMNLNPKVQWTRFYRDGGAGEPFRSQFPQWRDQQHALIRDQGALSIPVLIILPRHDPTYPLERAMALYDILGEQNPNVQMTIMNDAGHFAFREKPEEFNWAVIRFINAWTAEGEITP